MRPHQWAKNTLVFAPCLAAHALSPITLGAACVAFAAFSLCASGVYVLNDMVDLPHDRAHPVKRARPFASGALPVSLAPWLVSVLLGGAGVLGLFLPWRFLAMLLGYFVCTLTYSFVFKRRAVWDVMTLAGLYVIRIFAGAAATSVPVSPWLLAFAMFLFLCLAVVKRMAELVRVAGEGGAGAAGRGYGVEDLGMLRSMAASSGYMAVMVLALYVDGAGALGLYRRPALLWGLCPVLLFWVSRVLMLSHRGHMSEDPVVFALSDRVSLATGIVSAGVVLAAAW